MIRRPVVTRLLVSSSLALASASGAHAAEGGVTHYLPGVAGALGFGLQPEAGLTVTNIVWSQSGDIDETILAGQIAESVELETVLDIIAVNYTTDWKLLGGTYSVGLRLPFGHTSLNGERIGSSGSFDDSRFGLGDLEIVPLQLNWNRGDFHFELYQSVIAPTGNFDEDEIANVGRGYWSFDTVGAVTWLTNWGTEVSFAWGLMHNAENTNSEYHTSNESHVDWAVNQYLTDSFAIGVNGYRLNQLKGDSGEGAILGPLEGFEQGVGAGFVWTPEASNGQLSVTGTYMSDYEVRDGRFDSDYALLSLAWTF